MAGLGDMFGLDYNAAKGANTKIGKALISTPAPNVLDEAIGAVKQGFTNAKAGITDPNVLAGYIRKGLNVDALTKASDWRMAGLDAMTGSSDTPKAVQRAGVEAGMNIAMNAPAMTVWHGSPHKFDKFDMSKIGTGEGAQAYGHGLYMAESPEVAKSYAETLSGSMVGPEADVAKYWRSNGGEKAYRDFASGAKLPTSDVEQMARMISGQNGGALYKADIPDDAVARFLDWDKPLSEQPHIQRAMLNQDADWKAYSAQLSPDMRAMAEDMVIGTKPVHDGSEEFWNALYAKHPNLDHNEIHDTRWRTNPEQDDMQWLSGVLSGNAAIGSGVRGGGGADIYNSFGGGADAANRLKELGIPGIRYLDGGSRGTGAGTSNFVLFDDQMPRILEVNGQATGAQPWKPGEYQSAIANAFSGR